MNGRIRCATVGESDRGRVTPVTLSIRDPLDPRIESVPDCLFEGEEAVLHVMGSLGGAAVREPGQSPCDRR
jgi:hypothetical protein